MVEAEQRLGGDLGDRQLADAEHRLELVGSRELADGDELGDVVLLVLRRRRAEPRQPERPGDARLDERRGSRCPCTRSMISASTQWADVAWYS